MRKPRSKAEVYNDLDGEVVNVFRVYQDSALASELIRKLEATPFARDEVRVSLLPTDCPVEKARRSIVKAFQGFASAPGHKHPGFRCATSTQNTTAANDWVSYVDQAKQFTERLRGVTIENVDALELLGRYDTPETLYYLDPPYVPDSRTSTGEYRHEMTGEDHLRMVEVVRGISGFVVISGYENELYDSLGWTKFASDSYAQGNNAEMRKRTEVIWLNPAAVAAMPQADLFAGSSA